MKTYTVTYLYMVDAESMEDAVKRTVKDLEDQIRSGAEVPFTVDDMVDGERRLIVLGLDRSGS